MNLEVNDCVWHFLPALLKGFKYPRKVNNNVFDIELKWCFFFSIYHVDVVSNYKNKSFFLGDLPN